jgi:hypothetical protein
MYYRVGIDMDTNHQLSPMSEKIRNTLLSFMFDHLFQDRIKFGSNTLYLYIGFPSERSQEDDDTLYDYDYFQTELAEGSSSFKGEIAPRGDVGGSHTSLNEHGATHLVFQEYISLLPKVHEANAMSEDMKKVRYTLPGPQNG